jgi:hypothetical protein
MNPWVLRGLVLLALLAGGAWLLKNTEWVQVQQPLPLSPALAEDGTLVAQQLLQRLGMQTCGPAATW